MQRCIAPRILGAAALSLAAMVLTSPAIASDATPLPRELLTGASAHYPPKQRDARERSSAWLTADSSPGHQESSASSTPNTDLPAQQIRYSDKGVQITLSSLVFGVPSLVGPLERMTLIVENDQTTSVYLAALPSPSGLRAVLTDGKGGVCVATSAIGIPRLNPGSPESAIKVDSIPPRSRVDVVLVFQDCGHLSPDNLSFSGTFALLEGSNRIRHLTVPLWGIKATTVR